MRRNAPRALRVSLWLTAIAVGAAALTYAFIPGAYENAVSERFAQLRDQATTMIAARDDKAGSRNAADGGTDTQQAARSEGPEDGPASGVQVVAGETTVALDAEAQRRAGLRTEALSGVTFTPEIAALGRVVDLQPLLAQRARFSSARAQAAVVRATLDAAKADYDRLAGLSREEGDIARKRLLQADADVKRAEAELGRYDAEMRSVRDETRQQWGPVLASWALAGSSPEFERLLAHEDVLLLVTLPPGTSLPAGVATVLAAKGGERDRAVEAAYISPAPTTDPVVQGETHFFRAKAEGLRAGMRLDVWAKQSQTPESGVIVPQDAVVWALGQAWAYVQIDKRHFARRPIPTDTQAPGGWFVTDAVKDGESVVVAGAQILYAEEFRWQIRNEDDN